MTADRRNGNPGRRQADTIAAAAAVDRVLEVEKRIDAMENVFGDHVYKQDREFAELRERDAAMKIDLKTMLAYTERLKALDWILDRGGKLILILTSVGGAIAAFLALKGASGN